MRILLTLETSGGGSGRHVLDLATGLSHRGHDVTFVWSPDRAEEKFVQQLQALRAVSSHPLSMRRAVGLNDVASLRALSNYICNESPFDILHGHSSKAGALVRLLPRNVKGARIYTPHAFRTMDPTLSRVGRLFYGGVERTLSHRCDAIVVGSTQEAEEAVRLGICLAKIKRTAFGVNAPVDALSRDEARRILGLSNTDTVVGFVGRLAHQKAPERLVNAIAECPRQDVKLVLIGGGALEVRLREDIGRLRIGGRVVFGGVLDGQAMMPAFDLLCVPSRYESLGYVLLEAALAGLPIISSPVGVAEEVIQNGRNGLIVPNVDDPKPWADALERMLAPEELLAATSYAQSLRRTASVGRMVDETIDVYHGALRSQSLGAR